METANPEKSFKYEEIACHIMDGITTGLLPCGSRLPSLRELSRRYQCALSVAMQAYRELETSGIVRCIEKSGFFVAPPKSAALPVPGAGSFSLKSEKPVPSTILGQILDAGNNKSILPLGAGIPDASLMPVMPLTRSTVRILKANPQFLQSYTEELGSFRLRSSLSALMLERGVHAPPDRIMITNGCTEALSTAVRAVSAHGDAIAVESPVYLGMVKILHELGRRTVSLPCSVDSGIDLNALEAALSRNRIKACVVNPVYQNPLGFVMPEEHRKRLCDIANEHDMAVIEDDIYADCSWEQKSFRPLKAFDTGNRVIYCSSFSKTVAPGMRIGWMIPGRYMTECRDKKTAHSLGGPRIMQEAMAEFLESTAFPFHIRQFRKKIAKQAAQIKHTLLEHFPEGTAVTSPGGGYFFWVELPGRIDAVTLFREALEHKISIVPGPAFSMSGEYPHCIRISCGAAVTEETLTGIAILGNLARAQVSINKA